MKKARLVRIAIAVALTFGAVSCASSTQGQAVVPISAPSSDMRSSDLQRPTSAASSASQLPAVPAYLRAACGHPNAQATLVTVPITIPRDLCDLTGVVVLYGQTGVTVPSDGEVQAFADFTWGAAELSADVDPTTGDVTFR
jgi:hypothetical protein